MISARNQDIIMVYEAVIKVDIYGVGLANTRFLDNITLMFLLNFQVEVIINMFIKREPTPYKEHEVNTPYSTSNFRD
jgi:biotin synthase-like enzyme